MYFTKNPLNISQSKVYFVGQELKLVNEFKNLGVKKKITGCKAGLYTLL